MTEVNSTVSASKKAYGLTAVVCVLWVVGVVVVIMVAMVILITGFMIDCKRALCRGKCTS